MNRKIKKVIRFITIYGLSRTFYKTIGRLRISKVRLFPTFSKRKKKIGMIGCGQYAFSTIGFFLKKNVKSYRFSSCFDIDREKSNSFAKFFGSVNIAETPEEMFSEDLDLVYIASNHHSHTDYAIQAMTKGLDVFIEKPISVNREQFDALTKTIQETGATIYAGYNRPFSGAILDLKKQIQGEKGPFSINYFISGHKLEEDHWYRNPKEGTRICGNVGHWLDLTVHILSWRSMPDQIKITVSYSNITELDDNISIAITTDLNDIITIMLTSRSEPFEGINETINLQQGEVIAKIDDFRRMVIWKDSELIKKKYWPKDVGHKKSVMQPLRIYSRDWNEVELSTLLMLHIKEMVLNKERFSQFSFRDDPLKK